MGPSIGQNNNAVGNCDAIAVRGSPQRMDKLLRKIASRVIYPPVSRWRPVAPNAVSVTYRLKPRDLALPRVDPEGAYRRAEFVTTCHIPKPS